MADWRAFPNLNKMGKEWSRKLAPLWNMAAEMYRNEDFWGTQIFSPKEAGEPQLNHVLKNLKEGAAHLASEAMPFSYRSGQRFAQPGGKVLQYGPLVGFVPAPRYATQTPAVLRPRRRGIYSPATMRLNEPTPGCGSAPNRFPSAS